MKNIFPILVEIFTISQRFAFFSLHTYALIKQKRHMDLSFH